MKDIYILEGLDRLGKGTLAEEIQHHYGYYQVIHFGKPQALDLYKAASTSNLEYDRSAALRLYQEASFKNMFKMMTAPDAKIIFDRAHLGELVYSPLYRGYSGDYVLQLEKDAAIDYNMRVRLILLTEDFDYSKHFVEDGESFDWTKRAEEQGQFKNAFTRSIIKDKRMINVTDKITGQFRPKQEILQEAISGA